MVIPSRLHKAIRHAALALPAALLVALAWPAPVQAQHTSACTQDTCTLADFEAVREDTETLYGDVLLILSAHERPNLRSNQSEWHRSARQHCNQSAPAGADLEAAAASAHHACMIEQYQARRRELRHWLMHGYSVD